MGSPQLTKAGDFTLKAAFFAQDGGQLFLIGPSVWRGNDFFDLLKARLPRGEVKDASRATRTVRKVPRNGYAARLAGA